MADDYLGSEPSSDDCIADLGRSMDRNHQIAVSIKAERDRYEAALRKIAGWQGYVAHEHGTFLTDAEIGANDMLETLKQMAEEALA